MNCRVECSMHVTKDDKGRNIPDRTRTLYANTIKGAKRHGTDMMRQGGYVYCEVFDGQGQKVAVRNFHDKTWTKVDLS